MVAQRATAAHHWQKRKTGSPYVLHPLRMACALKTETDQIVAVLHDVIEDNGVRTRQTVVARSKNLRPNSSSWDSVTLAHMAISLALTFS
jgi:hypothetical protein